MQRNIHNPFKKQDSSNNNNNSSSSNNNNKRGSGSQSGSQSSGVEIVSKSRTTDFSMHSGRSTSFRTTSSLISNGSDGEEEEDERDLSNMLRV